LEMAIPPPAAAPPAAARWPAPDGTGPAHSAAAPARSGPHPARQRRHDQLPLRRQPALAPVAHRLGPQHEVLDQKVLVAAELRAGRHRGAQHPLLHRRPVAPPCRGGGEPHWRTAASARWPAPSARLDRWPALQPLEAGDLLALRRHRPLELRHLAQQRATSAFSSAGDSASGSAGGAMARENQSRS
jgi:hypothetical protein